MAGHTLPGKAFLRQRDMLRLGLLVGAMAANLIQLYQFAGSMIWFRQYLGDYNVFWGITKIHIDHIYDQEVFAYPPSALLLIKPFGVLPFWLSLVVWSVTGGIAFVLAFRRIVPATALFLAPATFAVAGTLLGGQISLFTGALIMTSIVGRTSIWRGSALAAAALIKPQSLLAAPVKLIAERDWATLVFAAAVGLAILFFSVWMFGLFTWSRWFSALPEFHRYLVDHGIDRLDVGLYGFARSAGLPGAAFLLGIPLGLATSWLVFRSQLSLLDKYAAFAASTVLMSPYTLYYDLAGLTLASLTFLLDPKRGKFIWVAAALILTSVFAAPGIVLLAISLCREAIAPIKPVEQSFST